MRSRSRGRQISLKSGAGAGAEVEVAFTFAMGTRPEPKIVGTHIRSLLGAGAVQKMGRLQIPATHIKSRKYAAFRTYIIHTNDPMHDMRQTNA